VSGNKTLPTDADVGAFIAGIENETRRGDAETLLRMMTRVTGMEPVMWGETIIGFGQYHYKYESGREGDYFLTGFSPRKAATSVYIMPGFKRYGDRLARLGRHRHSVSCLYINRLAAIDMAVLEEMVADSVARMQEMYPHWSA
jgi:hypothetical protein